MFCAYPVPSSVGVPHNSPTKILIKMTKSTGSVSKGIYSISLMLCVTKYRFNYMKRNLHKDPPAWKRYMHLVQTSVNIMLMNWFGYIIWLKMCNPFSFPVPWWLICTAKPITQWTDVPGIRVGNKIFIYWSIQLLRQQYSLVRHIVLLWKNRNQTNLFMNYTIQEIKLQSS